VNEKSPESSIAPGSMGSLMTPHATPDRLVPVQAGGNDARAVLQLAGIPPFAEDPAVLAEHAEEKRIL
jgi:hypothetical protein